MSFKEAQVIPETQFEVQAFEKQILKAHLGTGTNCKIEEKPINKIPKLSLRKKKRKVLISPEKTQVSKKQAKQIPISNFFLNVNKNNILDDNLSDVRSTTLREEKQITKKIDFNSDSISAVLKTEDVTDILDFKEKVSIEPCDNIATLESKNIPKSEETEIPETQCSDQKELSFLSSLNWEDFENDFSTVSDETLKELPQSKQKLNELALNSSCPKKSDIIKFKIINKKIINYVNKNEVHLLLENPNNSTDLQKCILQGFWTESVLSENDIVSIINPRFDESTVIVDNKNGFLIVNPDLLISSTAVVSTLFCMRKAVLNSTYSSWGSSNRVMIIGNLVHQLFQEAVNEQKYLAEEIEVILSNILKYSDNLIAMCGQNLSEEEIRVDLKSYISSISEWINKYCTVGKNKSNTENLIVNEVRDIEDNIWCLKYGLKGRIDLTVEVDFPSKNVHKLMPLELKTGNPSFSSEHIGQVNLYTLMMEDRTNNHSDGLLLYLKNGPQMKEITQDHNILRGLIQLRNELVHYCYNKDALKSKDDDFEQASYKNCYLPDPISNKRSCERCSYLLPCTVYQRAYNKEVEPNHAMFQLVPKTTSHLSTSHLDYFKHWSFLLHLESTSVSIENNFWDQDACTREKEGKCFSYMVLRDDILTQQEKSGDAYVHTFFRAKNSPINIEFISSGIQSGDYIAISNQENSLEVALCTGHIICITPYNVQVSMERDLQKLTRYQNYVFRIDKITSSGFLGLSSYSHLMKIMRPEKSRLREIVIDKVPASFVSTMSKNVAVKARPYLKFLNKPQRKAVFKVLMAKDYTLLKGMPGTGKTATIVALVRLLVEMGFSVLLTSHTHSAVDNILLKLINFKCDFVRIGKASRIHPDILQYSFQTKTKNMTTVKELSTFIKSQMIVASTCLGINHVIFEMREFDYCIVDEASQIVQPVCLGPLFCASKFVLAGDPKQLPPVVINEQAKKNGLQESLFSRLETESNCIDLYVQYRMNKEIMRVCSHYTYNNTMECGSDEVATSVLDIDLSKIKDDPKWLSEALDNQLNKSLFFLNTDIVPAPESYDNLHKVKNEIEVSLVSLLVLSLIKCNLQPKNIGIIAPYRLQVDLILNQLLKLEVSNVEVNTVDQYQGRDKEAIIMSCVRSGCDISSNKKESMIIGDERRLNVAISRAKKKLLIIGSKSTLCKFPCFEKFFTHLLPYQILNLPENAHHSFKIV